MLEAKRPEKDRFSGKKWWIDRGIGQPAQPARVPVDRLLFPNWGSVERWKNLLSLPIAFLSQSRDLPSWLRSDRGYQSPAKHLMLQRLVNRLTPSSTDQGCFLVFWFPMLETYKLRAPLHLWIREHLHLFVYLLVLAIKALILFLVH